MTQTGWILFTVFLNVVLAGDWSVNLPTGPICAVTGFTVVFPCSYDYPQSGAGQQYGVMSEMWCLGESRCITQRYVYHSAGIFLEPSYQSRVEYLGKLGSKKCELKISDVRQSDSGTYVFYLITNHTTEKMPAQRGIQLLVAGSLTEVTVLAGPSSDITEGESVHLSCCANTGAQAKWYKTSSPTPQHLGPVWTINKAMSKDSGSYYCQTESNDKIQNSTELALDVQYPPRNTVVSVSSEETQAGRPVTLTCSSDANPPVLTYTWFKDAACDPTADTSFYKAIQSHSMPTRRSQTLSSVNVSADESKVHCCVARNRHGSQKSTVKLNKSSETAPSNSGGKMLLLGVTIAVVLAIIASIAFIMKRRKTSSSRRSYVSTPTTSSVL